jgi:hypothetical protein
MNLKHYMCKLSGLAPKVKLGPLEWEMPGLMRSLLDCEVNQRKITCYGNIYGNIRCHTDVYENSVCVVIPQEEANKTSRILMRGTYQVF